MADDTCDVHRRRLRSCENFSTTWPTWNSCVANSPPTSARTKRRSSWTTASGHSAPSLTVFWKLSRYSSTHVHAVLISILIGKPGLAGCSSGAGVLAALPDANQQKYALGFTSTEGERALLQSVLRRFSDASALCRGIQARAIYI